MASTIPVVVDSHLRMPDFFLEYEAAGVAMDELTIPNKAKEIARRRKQWGWQDLPDSFELFDINGDNLIFPRGYALQLKLLLREHGYRVEWIDRRRHRKGPAFMQRQEYDPKFVQQPRAVKRMLTHQQGIYEAPTGSGKTVAGVRFIQARRPLRSIILVDQVQLLLQWKSAFNDWLMLGGDYVGQIGDGVWDTDHHRITVAMVQSIWSRMKREPEFDWTSWYDDYDAMVLDECHHASAETLQQIVGNFTAWDRLGMSATADRLDGKFEITQAILGEVIQQDSEEELRDLGVLVKPVVHVLRTPFRFHYWSDHESTPSGLCEVPGCKRKGQHGHRNNYQKLKDAVAFDPARNSFIAAAVATQAFNAQEDRAIHFVITNEVRHIETLVGWYVKACTDTFPHWAFPQPYVLTGRVTGKKREQMIGDIQAQPGGAVVFATVAKEGLDIPRISHVYLAWPDSNPKITQQKIGRATRAADGKLGAQIFDFLDPYVPKLKQQFRNRRYKCYDKLDIEVLM